ncbi:GPI transamidase component GAB1 [Candida viswanathii]|uniref:GPI transamidase component GAB1 n=1 Tax=Candida viswanathii TaxID=5486 RepID=A0A367YJ38_9ASCO|nr:GPI transamidase component GAB1 [Candida viswanathii]
MSKVTNVIIIGSLIRFLLPTLFPQITTILDSSVDFSTPITSFKSLQESFYYFSHGINLYDGGNNHHAPLLVILLSFVNSLPGSSIWFNLLYTAVDVLITYKLIFINRWYNEYLTKRTGRKHEGFEDYLIACFYLFNPLIILTNLSHSTVVFPWVFLFESVVQIIKHENVPRAMISLSIASYLSINYMNLIPCFLAFAHILKKQDPRAKIHQIYVEGLGIFVACSSLLVLTSFIVTASWKFLDNVYLTNVLFTKIKPNLGLWWYLFTEMFENYTQFYIIVFNLYCFIFVLPITLRLFEYSTADGKQGKTGDGLLAIVLCLIWISFTKSYPILGDLGLCLSLLAIFKTTVVKHCKFKYITGITLIVGLLLSPIFYYIWIVLGSGNANFFYSISLIWGGVHILLMMDLLWTKLSVDYYEENGVDVELEEKPVLAQI